MDSLNIFRSLLENSKVQLQKLNEAKGHIDHPEDSIFLGGSNYAKTALQAISNVVRNPQVITIKWDGYPALIFGRGPNGKFAMMDKHMFNKKDGAGRMCYTPEMFMKYDSDRGVNRGDLYQTLQTMWDGLSKEDQGYGYYWGDLLFKQPLQEKNGFYTFRANPNGITYKVDAKDQYYGQLLKNKVAGIAVHTYLPPNAQSTDDSKSLDGSLGQLKNNSNVAIIPSKMPITPKLTIDNSLINDALSYINKYGQQIDMMLTPPEGTKSFLNSNLFTMYINQKVRQGSFNNLYDDFIEYLSTRPMSDKVRMSLFGYEDEQGKWNPGHLEKYEPAMEAAFRIWMDIYNIKMSVLGQLDKANEQSPVKGYLQDGTETHEGFVAYGFKFVDRMGFSRQNLLGR